MGFFDGLEEGQSAVLLHRGSDGMPHSVTVPMDFSPLDVARCLNSFGFDATLGEYLEFEDPQVGAYVTIVLENVREWLPPQPSAPSLVAQGARRLVKRQVEDVATLLRRWAERL